jgi:dipeptidyl aminopeptidase/acylaminoacyl peptidase
MKNILRIVLSASLFVSFASSQTLEDMAPEVWSEPIRLFPTGTAVYPAITTTGDTLYCLARNVISRSIRTDGVWSTPEPLPPHVSSDLSKHPTITPDGRRLYFVDYGGYGGWDLWMTEWPHNLNDWGGVTNLGPTINTGESEWCAAAPDNNTLIFVRGAITSSILVSHWIDSTESWTTPISFDRERVSQGSGVHGITVTPDLRKVYVGKGFLVDGVGELEVDVSYRDSVSGEFSEPLRLNLNSHAPPGTPSYNPENRGYDAFPSITPDGKWLLFVSDRADDSLNTNYHDIYVSRLLIDENGDTVTTSVYDQFFQRLLGTQLIQNFPNREDFF